MPKRLPTVLFKFIIRTIAKNRVARSGNEEKIHICRVLSAAIKDSLFRYCQLKENFADPTAACWGLRLSEYHKW